jgi:hypothetical protein
MWYHDEPRFLLIPRSLDSNIFRYCTAIYRRLKCSQTKESRKDDRKYSLNVLKKESRQNLECSLTPEILASIVLICYNISHDKKESFYRERRNVLSR